MCGAEPSIRSQLLTYAVEAQVRGRRCRCGLASGSAATSRTSAGEALLVDLAAQQLGELVHRQVAVVARDPARRRERARPRQVVAPRRSRRGVIPQVRARRPPRRPGSAWSRISLRSAARRHAGIGSSASSPNVAAHGVAEQRVLGLRERRVGGEHRSRGRVRALEQLRVLGQPRHAELRRGRTGACRASPPRRAARGRSPRA